MNQSDKSNFILRNAAPADSGAINQLCIAAYEEFCETIGEANWRRLKESLSRASERSSEGELIVADDSSGLLGVVLYIPAGRSLHANLPANFASLQMLAVSPGHRGKGIGRKLTQECIDRARKSGAAAIALTTAEMMTVARPMYERMGFVKEADVVMRFGVMDTRYILRLK